MQKIGSLCGLRTLALTLALAIALSGFAGKAEAAGPPMWRLETAETTMYFLGTFHLLTPEIEWLTAEIVEAFEASDQLILELSPEQQNPGLIAFLVAEKGRYPTGRSLVDDLGEEAYEEVITLAASLGFPENMLKNLKPWYVATALTIQFSQVHEFDPELGVDQILSQEALNAGKKVLGLETAADQISALADLPMEVQVRLLKETVAELANLPDIWGSMIEAWSEGDVDSLESLLLESMSEEPEVYEALILSRNRNWLGTIEQLVGKRGTYFVAVGAAHLIGPDSLLDMLAEKGYSLERIESE